MSVALIYLLFLFFDHHSYFFIFFFFNDTATTEIYTLSLHDALPISSFIVMADGVHILPLATSQDHKRRDDRSEEHTSELQSHVNLVCRLLLEKKKKRKKKKKLSDTLYNITYKQKQDLK